MVSRINHSRNVMKHFVFLDDLRAVLHHANLNSEEKEIIDKHLNDVKWETWRENTARHPCPDALSASLLGEWRDDDLDIVPLKLNRDKTKIAKLQMINGVNKIPKIILILESPHKDEYVTKTCSVERSCTRYDKVRPAPARGQTGRNVKSYLPIILNAKRHLFRYHLVALVNPIQYQCSLGDLRLGVKDKIFCSLLKKESYKEDFLDRLKMIYNPCNDLIIVCCTHKEIIMLDKCSFCGGDMVFKYVMSFLSDKRDRRFPLLKMCHPCSWHYNCSNRKVHVINNKTVEEKTDNEVYCEKDYDGLYQRLSGYGK